MRPSRWTLAAVTFALFLAPILAAAAEPPVLSVEFSLQPGEQAGTYSARVLLSDATSGELLSAPSLYFEAGEPVKTASRTPAGDLVQLEVSVSADGTEVTYVAELIRDEKPIGLQKATLKLAG